MLKMHDNTSGKSGYEIRCNILRMALDLEMERARYKHSSDKTVEMPTADAVTEVASKLYSFVSAK